MCSKCAVDEGTFFGWCLVCGCAMGLFQGELLCIPDKCWCEDQPDVGDWHTLAEDRPDLLPPVTLTWEELQQLFD